VHQRIHRQFSFFSFFFKHEQFPLIERNNTILGIFTLENFHHFYKSNLMDVWSVKRSPNFQNQSHLHNTNLLLTQKGHWEIFCPFGWSTSLCVYWRMDDFHPNFCIQLYWCYIHINELKFKTFKKKIIFTWSSLLRK